MKPLTTNRRRGVGAVVAAGVTAVENTEVEPERRVSLNTWAVMLGLDEEDLQEMAKVSEKQKERLQSLVSNMTR